MEKTEKALNIAGLITKYINETINSEELDELQEWIELSAENKGLFEDLIDPKKQAKAKKLMGRFESVRIEIEKHLAYWRGWIRGFAIGGGFILFITILCVVFRK